MSSSEKYLFRDKFALYLAVGLLGPSKVIEYLNNDKCKERPVIPLYWRSKLMIPDPFRVLYHVDRYKSSISKNFPLSKLLFFDVTFHFLKKVHHQEGKHYKCGLTSAQNQPSFHISVSLGLFLLQQKRIHAVSEDRADAEIDGGRYISTQALDYEQIMSHVESLQLDPQSVRAEALASSMADEFLRQGSPSSSIAQEEIYPTLKIQHQARGKIHVVINDDFTINNSRTNKKNEDKKVAKNKTFSDDSQNFDESSTKCDMGVIIPYTSMGNSIGKLLLQFSPNDVTHFDRSALRFLSWDFSKNPNHFSNPQMKGESLLSQKNLVDDTFEQWQIQAGGNASKDDEVNDFGGARLGSSNKPVVSSMTVDSNGTNGKKKKRKAFKGMGILPSARRKRNKGLIYDKS